MLQIHTFVRHYIELLMAGRAIHLTSPNPSPNPNPDPNPNPRSCDRSIHSYAITLNCSWQAVLYILLALTLTLTLVMLQILTLTLTLTRMLAGLAIHTYVSHNPILIITTRCMYVRMYISQPDSQYHNPALHCNIHEVWNLFLKGHLDNYGEIRSRSQGRGVNSVRFASLR